MISRYFKINFERLENKILRMEIEEIMWKEEKKESYRLCKTSFNLFIFRNQALAQLVV